MILDLSQEYSISKLCEVQDLPRSTYYHQGQEKAGDQRLREETEKVIVRWLTETLVKFALPVVSATVAFRPVSHASPLQGVHETVKCFTLLFFHAHQFHTFW